MANITTGTWPQSAKEKITAPVASDLRQTEIQLNLLLTNLSTYFGKLGSAANAVIQPVTISRGTTVTFSATAGQVMIGGVPVAAFAAQANQAFGALGTIPQDTWGLVAFDMVGDGTITLVSAAANYTTGYATEALAIAAMPAVTAANARVAYITVLTEVGSTFVFATDSLEGGVSGNPSSDTNYYSMDGLYATASWTASQIATQDGTVLTSTQY
jgi:hypothetical protein